MVHLEDAENDVERFRFIQTYIDTAEVSCYTLHPLASRFVRLRRRVHVVSEWVTCVITTVCCPCCEAMPYSSSISCYTKPSEILEVPQIRDVGQLAPNPLIDPGRASGEPFRPQHITIDFTPRAEDSSATEDKCHQFWEFVANQPQLESFTVQPDTEAAALLETLSVKAAECPPEPHSSTDNLHHFPAIHAISKMQDKGAVKAALNVTNAKKY